MKNFEHIKYTYKHRKIVMSLAEKYFNDNSEVLEQVKSNKALGKAYCTAGVATALAIVTNSLKKKDKEEESEC